MSKILFIENRGKTALWEAVACDLCDRGHQVAWIVQNPIYTPKRFSNDKSLHIISFSADSVDAPETVSEMSVKTDFPELISDRGRRFFNAGAAHYQHYTSAIHAAIDSENPDLVVGESTLFHELIALAYCRKVGVPFAHPAANRYPAGRFSLFRYDSQVPASKSGEHWTNEEAVALADRIANGREIPFYMKRPTYFDGVMRRLRFGFAQARVLAGRLQGEKFNTPTPFRKLELGYRLRQRLGAWDDLACLPVSAEKTILYPLQMQPEANIDVWGSPYSDQVELIQQLLDASPEDFQVAVKSNPKSKYEISEAMLMLASSDRRICLLPRALSMTDAHRRSLGAVTVSGTVGFEAIFGRGRCLSLRHPLIEAEFPNFHAASPADAVRRLILEDAAGRGSVDEGARLVGSLVSQSFPGIVSEPLYHPTCMDKENVAKISDALCAHLAQVDHGGLK